MNSQTTTTTTARTTKPLRMAEIKRRNHAAGWCWFSKETMRFWSTRLCNQTTATASGKHTLFISSETAFPDQPNTARYTVCRFDHDTGHIHYASQFQEFDTAADALSYARKIANSL